MRIPNEVAACVCFVCIQDEATGEYMPIGTGFFVSVPTGRPDDDKSFVYTATARHVIEGAQKHGHDTVYLRVNAVAGGVSYTPAPIAAWKTRAEADGPDDFALSAHVPPRPENSYFMVDLGMFVDDQKIADHDIGIGDEVFLPGLFVNHVGTSGNLPIMRQGSVAAMPVEPVATDLGDLDAYLVEARSIGGLSGSPVFVNVGGLLRLPKHTMLLSSLPDNSPQGPSFLFLGMMHGHFHVKNIDRGIHVLTEEKINMGIGIVLPASRLLDLVRDPIFAAARVLALQSESES